MYSIPTVSSYLDPDVNIKEYKTFSVFASSLFSENTGMNEIMEKQMLFLLRNMLEAKGYKYIELNDYPDLLATLIVSSEYETTYIEPQTFTLPEFISGKTIRSNTTLSGSFDYNTIGSYSSYGWGNYVATSKTTTYIPGYITAKTYTRPGYSIGHYYPAVGISIYDGETLEQVWLGTGAGTSDNSDVRISSQLVIIYILEEFPNTPIPYSYEESDGVIGAGISILTNDGNNYLPTITKFSKKSPSYKAGIREHDMILSIDNTPVINKPFSYVVKLVAGNPGTMIHFEVWRTGKKLEFDVKRTSRKIFNNS